jgi:hypothetical protein
MVLTPLETYLMPLVPVCILFISLFFQQTKKVRIQHEKIVGLIKNQTKPESEELTEFLGDFKTYGYSFVRVDPGDVFYRSQRDK